MSVLQRLVSVFRVNLLLLSSIKPWKLFLTIVSCLSLIVFEFTYPQYAKYFHFGCATVIMTVFFYFFYKLKKQSFFKHIILNRGFFSVSLEVFLFLLPYLFIGLVLDLPYVIKFGKNTTGIFNCIVICESLCLVSAWFWRYIVARVIILVFETVIHFNPEMLATQPSWLELISDQQHSIICCVICIFVQVLAISFAIKADIRKTLTI